MINRICIFGAGGVGGYLAAVLARAGRDISVVARGPHLKAIQENGLRICSAQDEFSVRVPAADNLAALGQHDLIIVTAKVPDLPQIARDIAPALGGQTIVAFALNGVFWFYGDGFAPNGLVPDASRLDPHGILHRLIGPERSLGIVVRSSNEVIAPGVVRNANGGEYCVGEALKAGGQRLEAVREVLDAEGARVLLTSDIRRDMWRKLVRNTAIAVICGLTLSTPGNAFSDAGLQPLALAVMREVMAVAEAHGFGDLLDAEAEADIVGRMTAMKPSLVQDLERGRAMEIDAQILVVLDFARQAGVPTPRLDTLAPLLMYKARTAGCYPA